MSLQVDEVTDGSVRFRTTSQPVWATEDRLMRALAGITVRGYAYVGGNRVDESDVTELRGAIRRRRALDAAARLELERKGLT